MKLSQMKQVLAERRIMLTKSLGQNFLHDSNQLRRIVGSAELTTSDKVLEIGPGLGPLTELLLLQAGHVTAIEKDLRLVEILKSRFPPTTGAGQSLELIHADALDYLKSQSRDWSSWKLVSNLPYSIASPLLVELALAEAGPERIIATLQLEVAKRLTAVAGTPDYGLLSLLIQLEYAPMSSFKIPAGSFFPPPEVDSACVCLVRRQTSYLKSRQREVYVRLVKRGFSQRRKMMFKLLKEDWSAALLQSAFDSAHVDINARAESVSLEQFVQLTRSLASKT